MVPHELLFCGGLVAARALVFQVEALFNAACTEVVSTRSHHALNHRPIADGTAELFVDGSQLSLVSKCTTCLTALPHWDVQCQLRVVVRHPNTENELSHFPFTFPCISPLHFPAFPSFPHSNWVDGHRPLLECLERCQSLIGCS